MFSACAGVSPGLIASVLLESRNAEVGSTLPLDPAPLDRVDAFTNPPKSGFGSRLLPRIDWCEIP